MIQQEDSIVNAETQQKTLTGIQHVKKQPTPAQILSWLPKNATPEQQDSAIQANIKPSGIHWSNMPDTLHLPGQPVGKSWRDVNLPKYYKESFFSNSPWFHPELSGGRLGVAGDPVPYTIAGDNLITGILLSCFILAMVAFAQSHKFIMRQAKNFFYVQHGETTMITETSGELRFQFFLMLQTCLQFSLLFFLYARSVVSDTFIVEQYKVVGFFSGVILVYFLLKLLSYTIANLTFFDKKTNEQWIKSFLFINSVEGLLVFPVVMLVVYFGLALKTAFIYTAIVVILLKLLSLYKTYIIFFRQKGTFLQDILYFCALEVMPLLTLWGVLTAINGYLKINF